MDTSLFTKLYNEGLINEQELSNIKIKNSGPISVHRDLRTLLYCGIVLFTTASGTLVYKNIDTIGHGVILVVIAVIVSICFGYCFKYSKKYSHTKVTSPDIWFDYLLLSGCLLLLVFTGYIQYEYSIFGNRWGLALFIPMLLLFATAYYFDYLGVLSLAITTLAAWIGISVTPMEVLKDNNFDDIHIIYAGILLGVILIAASFLSMYKNIKAHFSFTYKNFGAHILFISLLALMFYFVNIYLVLFVLIAMVSFLFFKNAIQENSFYFLVITLLYAYIALSYVVIKLLTRSGFNMAPVYLGFIYFIGSGIGFISILIHYNKILKGNGGLQ